MIFLVLFFVYPGCDLLNILDMWVCGFYKIGKLPPFFFQILLTSPSFSPFQWDYNYMYASPTAYFFPSFFFHLMFYLDNFYCHVYRYTSSTSNLLSPCIMFLFVTYFISKISVFLKKTLISLFTMFVI